MGVLGLWELLESVGHPVKIEGLEGKVLGVDANIWLYKFIRGFREKDNATNIESHKLGLFNRICKLLFYRIKPVFVFDGPAPVLKRRTLERRQNIRNKHLMKHQDAAMKILANQLKSQYPNAKIDDLKITMPNLISNNLVAAEKLTEEDRDLFYLPETGKLETGDSECDESDDSEYVDNDFYDVTTKVDIHSKDFQELPPEMRYEILQDVKLSTKRIRNSGTLPEDANSFSNFQLERLKARRKVQQKIEECEKEICTNYTGELADGTSIQAFRVQSDAQATILYRPSTYNPEPIVKPETKPESDPILPKGLKPPSPESEIDLSKISPPHCTIDTPSEGDDSTINKKPVQLSETIEIGDDDSSSSDSDVEFVPIEIPSDSTDTEIRSDAQEDSSVELSEVEEEVPSITVDDDDDDNQPGADFGLKSSNSIDQIGSISSGFAGSQLDEIGVVSQTSLGKDSGLDEKLINSTEVDLIQESSKSSQLCAEPSSEPLHETTAVSPETQLDTKMPEDISGTPVVTSQPSPNPASPTISSVDSDKVDASSNPPTESNQQQTTEQPQTSRSTISSQASSSKVESGHAEPKSVPPSGPKAAAAAKRVTNKIVEDAKELLRLFGIPYIDAAGEAEAQCAKLEELKLTEGTITDDSDIWLFGAQNVFRYFFNEDKYVMQYKMTDIEFHIRMTRENLVCFAMMVGSDYTDGIMNIGHVTAVEVLSEFPGDGLSPLIQFRDWHKEALKDLKAAKKDVKRRKLLKYKLPDEFPSRMVYEGYLKPVADTSTESFTWGMPELDELREYARRNFGWDPKKVDEKLVPVMKRLNEKKIQKTIDTFFFKTQANRNPELFRSKRVNQALNKIAKRAARDGGPKPAFDDTIVLSEEEDDD